MHNLNIHPIFVASKEHKQSIFIKYTQNNYFLIKTAVLFLTMKATLKSKEEVQKAFQQLLEQFKRSRRNILTQEEKAKEAQNQKLVSEVSSHTPAGIVQGLAGLQLELGGSLEALSLRLDSELKKLENLRAAISVQDANLKTTLDARTAANALYVLQQEQNQRLQTLEEEQKTALERLEKEGQERRAEWAKEQLEFDSREADYKATLEKNRQKEQEEYKYNQERKQKIEQDKFDNDKKLLLRKLEEMGVQKAENWAAREAVLAQNNAEFEKHKAKVDGLEKEIEEKTKDAREKAIKQTSKECKEQLELLEREVAGKQKVAELQVNNAESTIAQQKTEIEKLNADLRDTLTQVQQLSLKALDVSKK